MTISALGCGRVGSTLLKHWAELGVFRLQEVVTKDFESAKKMVAAMGSGKAVASIEDFTPADVFAFLLPDDQISEQAERMSKLGLISDSTVVFHVSGLLDSEVFPQGLRASAHPAQTFAKRFLQLGLLQGAACALEGEEQALEILVPAFEKLGFDLIRINPKDKALYHAGLVLSCNHVLALASMAKRCLLQAGFDNQDAERLVMSMMSQTISNITSQGLDNALTGPIARGDLGTIKSELAALGAWDANVEKAYRILGLETVKYSKATGCLLQRVKKALGEGS